MSNVAASDGFDMYNGIGANTGLQSLWTMFQYNQAGGSAPTPTMVAGRFGGQALNMPRGTSGNTLFVRNLKASRAAQAFNMSFQVSSLSGASGGAVLAAYQSGTPQWGIGFNSSGALIVYRISAAETSNGPTYGATLGTSANGVVLNNTWHSLEVLAAQSTTVGTCDVYVDDVHVLNLTGLNNQNAGSANVDQFSIWSQFSGSAILWDDWVEIDAAARLGYPTRVEPLRGTSDSAVGWTPNSGANNYSRINETLVDGDTSYVSASVIGASDLYAMGALSSSPLAIYGVQAVDFGERTDANPRYIYQQVKSGATLSQGASVSLAGSYNRYERILTTDPNTGLPWSATAVNAMLHGPYLAA